MVGPASLGVNEVTLFTAGIEPVIPADICLARNEVALAASGQGRSGQNANDTDYGQKCFHMFIGSILLSVSHWFTPRLREFSSIFVVFVALFTRKNISSPKIMREETESPSVI